MLFTTKALSTLEYDKIIKMLVDCASTDGAKARASCLVPTDDYDVIISDGKLRKAGELLFCN